MIEERHKNICVSYLVLLKNNKILLLRRFNTGYEDGKYCMIAGHVNFGENFSQCVIREAKEEAGITLKAKDLEVVHVMHRKSDMDENYDRVDIFFIAKKWSGKIENREPDKCDNLLWFDIDNIPKNIIPYVKQAVNAIKNKIYYSEYGW